MRSPKLFFKVRFGEDSLGDKLILGHWLLKFLRWSWWFLSVRVFELLSSSLLLFSQRFGRYVLRPSSGVYRTREPTRNFELCPLLNPRLSKSFIESNAYNRYAMCPAGFRCWFPELLRRQSSGGCRFNPDCRRVTIQEYLILVSSYG